MATLLGHDWLQVTINGIADNLGFLENLRDGNIGRSMKKLTEKIDVALAGNVAERILGTVSEGSESDRCKATEYAKRIVRGGFCDDDEIAIMPDYTDSEHDWTRIRPKVNAILAARKKSWHRSSQKTRPRSSPLPTNSSIMERSSRRMWSQYFAGRHHGER